MNRTHVDFQVYCDVEPKRQALAQANLDLTAATEKLVAIRKKLGVSTNYNVEKFLSGSPHINLRNPQPARPFMTLPKRRYLIFHEYIPLYFHLVDTSCLLYAKLHTENVESCMFFAFKKVSQSGNTRIKVAYDD